MLQPFRKKDDELPHHLPLRKKERERERVAILAQVDPPLPYGGALEGGPEGLQWP